MQKLRLVFATNNQHKIYEVQSLLSNSIQIISAADLNCTEEIPEDQDTFEGNALQKANYLYNKYHLPCFADDSGLEVRALNGAPGVFSARYAGLNKSTTANNEKLLSELEQISDRSACFRCVIALIDSEGKEHLFDGQVDGDIALQASGIDGFGYDPLFIPKGYDRTFAEMSLTEKNKLSHRAKAVAALVKHLTTNKI